TASPLFPVVGRLYQGVSERRAVAKQVNQEPPASTGPSHRTPCDGLPILPREKQAAEITSAGMKPAARRSATREGVVPWFTGQPIPGPCRRGRPGRRRR